MTQVANENQQGSVAMPPALLQGLQAVHSFEKLGNLNQALLECHNLLVKFPEHPILLHYLGVLQIRLQQPKLAIDFLKRALKIAPTQVPSHTYLGIAHCQLQELDAGIEAYKKAIKLEPTYNEVYFYLGMAQVQKNNLDAAEKSFRKAIELNFTTPELFYNLGFLLHKKNKLEEAISYYEKALKLHPHYIPCLANIGEAYSQLTQFEKAVTHFSNLVRISPTKAHIVKMALALQYLQKHKTALHYLNEIKERTEEVYVLLVTNYLALKMDKEALETLTAALQDYPKNLFFMINNIHTKINTCNWQNFEAHRKTLFDSLHTDEYIYKYPQYYVFGFTFEQELQFAKRIASYYEDRVKKFAKECRFVKRRMNKKLKIGYVSANIRSHANAYTIKSLFPNHDHNHFDITLYATGKVEENSKVAQALIASAPKFVNLMEIDGVEAAKRIYQDDIDILVDFTGYHNQYSASIVALKPAKIQIGFMGTSGGTRGANFIDYVFNDKTVLPIEETVHFQEKVIYLPNSFYICSDDYVPEEFNKADLQLPANKFIFNCFNHALKYEPKSFDAWMKILAKVPDSILLLWVNKNPLAEQNLLNEAEKYGLRDRLFFTQTLEREKHLGRLKSLDLFLDSFICSAQSTAVDALSVGLPLITLYGPNVASRGAASILRAIDMPELITYSVEEYIEKAIYFATNPDILQNVKQKLINNKQTQPLFNSKMFVQHLEQAYTRVSENFEKGIKEHIFID